MEDKMIEYSEEMQKSREEFNNAIEAGVYGVAKRVAKEIKMEEEFKKVKKGYAEGSKRTQFKKGQKAWNFKSGIKLKRRYKKSHGKLFLKSHFVWCSQLENLPYIPKGFVIHHLDNNSLNDNPNNLLILQDSFHKSMHNILDLMAWSKLVGDGANE